MKNFRRHTKTLDSTQEKNANKDLFKAKTDDYDVKVRDSLHEFKDYHFKVLRLRSHEDTKQASECKVLFHFFFRMISKNP